ncbi:unnamed protein product [Anisakis simplex]|uniref:Gag-pol polyprotein n=1 Tax=Anisakis simplex TaxID=6269 RepID=A0A0M3KEK8_ANISI|nr:unnamed protein product [Anisakis simplex]
MDQNGDDQLGRSLRDPNQEILDEQANLHNQGQGTEALLSVPNALNSIPNPDYRQWMSFILEMSGVPDAIEKTHHYQMVEVMGSLDKSPKAIDGQPMYFNKENISKIVGDHERRRIELFDGLQSNLTEKQAAGGSEGEADESERVIGLDPDSPRRRSKRATILSPVFMTNIINNGAAISAPIVLSPIALTPVINSPSIYGTVILSPVVLTPLILSPKIFAPVILSPVNLLPIVLSPLAFDPFILSPGALVPLILSPLLFDPFIFSSEALTPVVLSPLAFSPFIFNPNYMAPVILSPFIFTPLLFSPPYVTALVLSPYAFSPLINSTGKDVSIILSPSAFS